MVQAGPHNYCKSSTSKEFHQSIDTLEQSIPGKVKWMLQVGCLLHCPQTHFTVTRCVQLQSDGIARLGVTCIHSPITHRLAQDSTRCDTIPPTWILDPHTFSQPSVILCRSNDDQFFKHKPPPLPLLLPDVVAVSVDTCSTIYQRSQSTSG